MEEVEGGFKKFVSGTENGCIILISVYNTVYIYIRFGAVWRITVCVCITRMNIFTAQPIFRSPMVHQKVPSGYVKTAIENDHS